MGILASIFSGGSTKNDEELKVSMPDLGVGLAVPAIHDGSFSQCEGLQNVSTP